MRPREHIIESLTELIDAVLDSGARILIPSPEGLQEPLRPCMRILEMPSTCRGPQEGKTDPDSHQRQGEQDRGPTWLNLSIRNNVKLSSKNGVKAVKFKIICIKTEANALLNSMLLFAAVNLITPPAMPAVGIIKSPNKLASDIDRILERSPLLYAPH